MSSGLEKSGEVAIRGRSFGMSVIGYNPVLSKESANKLAAGFTGLNKIFSGSDIITVYVPLNDGTENLISKSALKECKNGVKIIICARGGIVGESSLPEALNSGKLSKRSY